MFRGDHVDHPQVSTWRAAEVGVDVLDSANPVDLWASGELAGPLPARIEPVAGALAVVVPAPRAT